MNDRKPNTNHTQDVLNSTRRMTHLIIWDSDDIEARILIDDLITEIMKPTGGLLFSL